MSWIPETLYQGWQQRFRATSLVARTQSPFQDIQIIDTSSHGRVMLLDGVVQITEADEFAYQEMIAHVPLFQHGAAERVLIIGAGDGGVLRRVLLHRSVRRAVMVEIDGAVISLARLHLPKVGGDCWDDPRATVIVGDGIAHVAAAADNSFDVIIVDSTDPVGPGEALFSEAFYNDCARILTPEGLLVNQAGVPFMQPKELSESSRLRRQAFAHVSAYVVAVPTYVGGFMTLGVASNQPITLQPILELERRADVAGIVGTTQYWSPAVHNAAFALPPYIAKNLPV